MLLLTISACHARELVVQEMSHMPEVMENLGGYLEGSNIPQLEELLAVVNEIDFDSMEPGEASLTDHMQQLAGLMGIESKLQKLMEDRGVTFRDDALDGRSDG